MAQSSLTRGPRPCAAATSNAGEMSQLPAGSGLGGGHLAKMSTAPYPVCPSNRNDYIPTNLSSCQQSCCVSQCFLNPAGVVRPIAPGVRLSPQRLPPGLPCTVRNDQKLLTQVQPPHHYCYPIVLTENMTVPVTLNLPVVPVMLKPAAVPSTLTPQAEAVCEIVAPPREPANPEGLQFVPVHQSEVIPAGQQLPSQYTDRTEGESATSLSTEQQPAGMPVTHHSITKSSKKATSNSENLTSEALDVTTGESNQPVKGSNDEPTGTDIITTTQCNKSPAEDVIGGTEKASTDMKKGSHVAEEDDQSSSDNDPGKAGDGRPSSSTESSRAVSSGAGKAAGRKGPRKGGKVIVDISGTTYFMSRKRWRLLHKQWYVLTWLIH